MNAERKSGGHAAIFWPDREANLPRAQL